MQKVLIFMLCSLLMVIGTAHAEHKLLITDVLDKKQMEAEVSLFYSHSSFDVDDFFSSGKAKEDAFGSRYSFGVGLGNGIEVNASIPFLFSDKMKTSFTTRHGDGFGDLSIGAKYRILDEETKPVTAVAGLDLKLDTAGNDVAGSGTTDVNLMLAISKKMGDDLRPYASYQGTFRNHNAANTHALIAGAEKGVTKDVTLLGELAAFYNTSSSRVTDNVVFGASVSSYLQVRNNLYVIPAVSATYSTSSSSKESGARFGSGNSVSGTVSLYYLF